MLVKTTGKISRGSVEFIDNPEVVFKPETVEFNVQGFSIEVAYNEIEVITVFDEHTLFISTIVGYRVLVRQHAAEPVYTQITARLGEGMVETVWNC